MSNDLSTRSATPARLPGRTVANRDHSLWALFDLLRLPLLFTAIADSTTVLLLGWLAAERSSTDALYLPGLLVLTVILSAGLYGFGMALNDVLDAPADTRAGKPRPIATGRLTRRAGALVVMVCLMAALLAAAGLWSMHRHPQTLLATGMTIGLIVLYHTAGKRSAAVSLLLLGSIRAVHAQVSGLWSPTGMIVSACLMMYVSAISAAAYHAEQKQPPLSRPGCRAVSVTASLIALCIALLAITTEPGVVLALAILAAVLGGVWVGVLRRRPGPWIIRVGLLSISVAYAVLWGVLAAGAATPNAKPLAALTAAVMLVLPALAAATLWLRLTFGPKVGPREADD